MIETSAPGNLFFGGEHRIVYGGSAIITSIDKRTNCCIEKRRDDRLRLFSAGYGKIDERMEDILSREFKPEDFKKDEMSLARYLIKSFHDKFQIYDGSGMEIFIDSEIPKTCSGLSRSTSFACSLFKALTLFYEIPAKEESYFNYILPVQKMAHGGSASGVETISSIFGGFNRVDSKGNRKDLGKHKFFIVIGDTGVDTKTSETVSYVRKNWERDRESYEQVFKTIDDIIEEEIKAIKNEDPKLLGKLMNRNQEILERDLGVSHPKLNKMIDACKKEGAYGAKLSGGGGGGVMFALSEERKQSSMAKAILSVGGTPYVTRIGVGGLK